MGEKDDGSLVSNDYVTNYIPSDSLGVQLKLKNGDIAVGDYDNNGTDDVVFTGEDANGVPVTRLFEYIPGIGYKESSILLGKLPPAWAKSFLPPPPPFPPIMSEPALTSFTASNFFSNALVTPTPSPTLSLLIA